MPRRPLVAVVAVVAALLAGACSYRTLDVAPVIPSMSESSRVFAADGSLLTVLHAEQDRDPVSFAELPQSLIDAVVSIEDKRFWKHHGVDVRGVLRAAGTNAAEGEVAQGGSTITQQYVKNALLDPAQTVDRKMREMALAWQLERTTSKELILELYLNTIYFGHGAYGVQAASRVYFGKPVHDLDLAESALLAGQIQSPSATDPYLVPERALNRRNVVLDEMLADGVISPAEHAAARNQPLGLVGEFVQAVRYPAAHFVEEVKQFILGDARFGATEEARRDLLFGGGLRISTTLDLRLQAEAERAVGEVLPDPSIQPDAALVALDPLTGHVRAMVGGRDYFGSSPHAKYNLALGVGRQAGSTFKPFVLAAALEQGIPLSRTYRAPAELEIPMPGGQEPWQIRNYGGAGGGSTNLTEATIRSYNTVYAQLMREVGPDVAVEMAHRLGIVSPIAPVPAAVLGTENVTVLEMASAYGTFANRGVHVAPVLVTKVTTSDGTILYEAPHAQARALQTGLADQVNDVLRQVMTRGTGAGAAIDRPVAGKTGTAEGHRDAWFVGYTPRLAAAVWVGYPQAQIAMVPPTTPITVTGGSWPAEIWRSFMEPATADLPPDAFVDPSGATRPFTERGPGGGVARPISQPANRAPGERSGDDTGGGTGERSDDGAPTPTPWVEEQPRSTAPTATTSTGSAPPPNSAGTRPAPSPDPDDEETG